MSNEAGFSPPNAGPRLERPSGAPKLYAQDGKGLQATVHAHYFLGSSDWLVTEYDPEEDLAFGWACLNGDRQNAELGYVSLAELERLRAPLRVLDVASGEVLVSRTGQPVELDLHWPPGRTIEQGIRELDQRHGRGGGN